MKNFFRKFHLWVSVPFGLVIVITCFTGAMLVFEDEVTALCNGDVDTVEPAGHPLPLDVIAEKVEACLPDSVDVAGIVVSDDPEEAYMVNLSKPRRAAVYVNQYTGEIKGNKERLPFFQVMFRLHRWLMDSNPGDGAIFWGKIIVGASTLAFVVILLTGAVIWWPRNRKMLKNRLKIAVGKGKKRFWYDLHVAGGIYAFLFLLVMALTGLTWSFEWYRNGFYSVFGVETTKQGNGMNDKPAKRAEKIVAEGASVTWPVAGKEESPVAEKQNPSAVSGATAAWNADATSGATQVAGNEYVDAASEPIDELDATSAATPLETEPAVLPATPWQAAFEAVAAENPDFSRITVSAGTISVQNGGFGNQRASDKYTFDKETGSIVLREPYKFSSPQSKLRGWIYSLHVGSWGGSVTRVLAFLAALLGATLPLTGYYFWIRRLYMKRRKDKE